MSINRLNIVTDFGEIARAIDPKLSMFFHQRGIQILDDPILGQTNENLASLGAQLLTREDYVQIRTPAQRRAWVTYQLALDYLALQRKGEEAPKNLSQHGALMKDAAHLDLETQGGHIRDIYLDQLAVLDLFLRNDKKDTKSGP